MLVLMRKCGEEIVIGENISIKITEISGDKVKIGIEAPRDVKVYRKEICQTMESNKAAAAPAPVSLGSLRKLLEKNR